MIKSLLIYVVVIAGISAALAGIAIDQIQENQNTRQSQIDYYTK